MIKLRIFEYEYIRLAVNKYGKMAALYISHQKLSVIYMLDLFSFIERDIPYSCNESVLF